MTTRRPCIAVASLWRLLAVALFLSGCQNAMSVEENPTGISGDTARGQPGQAGEASSAAGRALDPGSLVGEWWGHWSPEPSGGRGDVI
jgi:hypothetical protein